MSYERLNRFKLDSTRFQQAFNTFTFSTMLDDLLKRTEHLVRPSVECMWKQMLKPFKRAFTHRFKDCSTNSHIHIFTLILLLAVVVVVVVVVLITIFVFAPVVPFPVQLVFTCPVY